MNVLLLPAKPLCSFTDFFANGTDFVGIPAGIANRVGVSAKPWHFRRRRAAENARVQSRPKIEELAGVFCVTAHAVCAEFYCWNCFAEGAGDFSGIEPEKSRVFVKLRFPKTRANFPTSSRKICLG